jgi:hypothetical protein
VTALAWHPGPHPNAPPDVTRAPPTYELVAHATAADGYPLELLAGGDGGTCPWQVHVRVYVRPQTHPEYFPGGPRWPTLPELDAAMHYVGIPGACFMLGPLVVRPEGEDAPEGAVYMAAALAQLPAAVAGTPAERRLQLAGVLEGPRANGGRLQLGGRL